MANAAATTTTPQTFQSKPWSKVIAVLLLINFLNLGKEFFFLNDYANTIRDSTLSGSRGLGKDTALSHSPDDCTSFGKKKTKKKFGFEKTDAQDILDLVGNTDNYTCPEGLVLVKDKIHPSFYEDSIPDNRKIPKVVHFTSKTRCMTEKFADNLLNRWGGLDGHSVFLHDDDAVDRLLNRKWNEFPHLQEGMKCLYSGAAKADLWRYVLIWEYGGIYTDIDNGVGPMFYDPSKNVSAIEEDTEALFEQERGGFPSQYFFAAAPHHPVMYYTVFQTMERLFVVENVKEQYIPFVTGPGAVKSGVISFMGGDGYPKKGVYTGTHNRTITIVGSPEEAKQGLYVRRDDRSLQKAKGFDDMGIVRYGTPESKKNISTEACRSLLYSLHKKDFEEGLP